MRFEEFICPVCGAEQPKIYEVYENVTAYAEVTYAGDVVIMTNDLEVTMDENTAQRYVCSECGETIANSEDEFMALFSSDEDNDLSDEG